MALNESFPENGEEPWGPEIQAWASGVKRELNVRLSDANIQDTVVTAIEESPAVNEAIASMRLTRGAVSKGIHGWHTSPQHFHLDGLDYIGGIEGNETGTGNSDVVVDIIDYTRNLATRVPLFQMPVDDHSPAAVSGATGCPITGAAVPHQTGRSVSLRSIFVDSFGIVTLGEIDVLFLPNPSDIGATTTYVQLEPINAETAKTDGFTDFFITIRLAWHWFAGVVRKDNTTGRHQMTYPWVDMMTFRDPGFPADGDQLQGYLNTYRRADGKMDVMAFGHPNLSSDRDIYVFTIDFVTGDIGGIGNLYTGAGLPLNRRQMELAYKRQANTNIRCLGVGGLSKRQALIAKWDTTSGTTAATPPNNRYKLLTRGAAPAYPGAVTTGAGYVASADRAAYDTTNLGVEVYMTPTSIAPAAAADLASKWVAGGNQRSWRLFLDTNSKLNLSVSADGTNFITLTSTVAVPAATKGLGVGYVASTGVATFYSYDGTSWSVIGTAVGSTPTAIYNSTTSLQIGRAPSGGNNTLAGTYQRFVLRDGWNSATIAANLDFTKGWGNGDTAGTSRVDYLGNAWVLQTGVTISAVAWTETADLGPTGEPVGYAADIQYIAGGMLLWHRDDAAMLSRRLPGGLARTVIARVQENGLVVEDVLAEGLDVTHFRPVPVIGEGGPALGSVSVLLAYGPDYTQYSAYPLVLWNRGPVQVTQAA